MLIAACCTLFLSVLLIYVRCSLSGNVFYSVEFQNSGRVKPLEPRFTVGYYRLSDQNTIDVVLLVALYFLAEELQDMIMLSFKTYFVSCGWLNLIDWFCILSAFLMEVAYYQYIGSVTASSDR